MFFSGMLVMAWNVWKTIAPPATERLVSRQEVHA
jgi:cbb3-type cytochrome oxidase subunit 1